MEDSSINNSNKSNSSRVAPSTTYKPQQRPLAAMLTASSGAVKRQESSLSAPQPASFSSSFIRRWGRATINISWDAGPRDDASTSSRQPMELLEQSQLSPAGTQQIDSYLLQGPAVVDEFVDEYLSCSKRMSLKTKSTKYVSLSQLPLRRSVTRGKDYDTDAPPTIPGRNNSMPGAFSVRGVSLNPNASSSSLFSDQESSDASSSVDELLVPSAFLVSQEDDEDEEAACQVDEEICEAAPIPTYLSAMMISRRKFWILVGSVLLAFLTLLIGLFYALGKSESPIKIIALNVTAVPSVAPLMMIDDTFFGRPPTMRPVTTSSPVTAPTPSPTIMNDHPSQAVPSRPLSSPVFAAQLPTVVIASSLTIAPILIPSPVAAAIRPTSGPAIIVAPPTRTSGPETHTTRGPATVVAAPTPTSASESQYSRNPTVAGPPTPTSAPNSENATRSPFEIASGTDPTTSRPPVDTGNSGGGDSTGGIRGDGSN